MQRCGFFPEPQRFRTASTRLTCSQRRGFHTSHQLVHLRPVSVSIRDTLHSETSCFNCATAQLTIEPPSDLRIQTSPSTLKHSLPSSNTSQVHDYYLQDASNLNPLSRCAPSFQEQHLLHLYLPTITTGCPHYQVSQQLCQKMADDRRECGGCCTAGMGQEDVG